LLVACLAADPGARPTTVQLRDELVALGSAAAPTRDMATRPAPVVAPAAAFEPGYAPPPGAGAAPGPAADPPPLVGPRTRRWLTVAAAATIGAAVAVAAFLILVPADGDPQAGPGTVPGASAAPVPADIDTVIDVRSDDRFGTDPARFVTPSGNIACAMSDDEVRCDVAQRSWTLPAIPADCEQEFGAGAVLSGGRVGELTCAEGTVAGRGLEVLEYGSAVRRKGVLCASRETGVRCEDEQSRHGFQVARADYELF
jgi:hypothetical protein